MRRNWLPAWLLVVVVALGAPCGAEKITEDPNAPGAARPQTVEDDIKADERLAQTITYFASGERVVKIVAALSEMSGVRIEAGLSDSDWQVRDRRMSIYARDLPLAKLLSSMARVMKFKWSIRGEPGAYTYRLFLDRRDILEAETAKLREEERAEREMTARRKKMLDDYDKLAKMSEEEIAALRRDNPFLYLAATTGLSSSLGTFFRDTPAAYEALAGGQELMVRGDSLSPAARQAIAGAANALKQLEAKMGGHTADVSEDLEARMDQVTIRLIERIGETEPMMAFMLGSMKISYPDSQSGNSTSVTVPFMDPDNKFARVIADIVLDGLETGKTGEELMENRQQDFMDAAIEMMKPRNTGEAAVEHPEDPELLAKVEIEGGPKQLSEFLKDLADKTKLSFVSDHFAPAMGFLKPGEREVEIQEALEEISEGFGYNWDRKGGVLELFDRQWFGKRANEIPFAWIERWRDTLRKTGTLDLDDLSSIAGLTQEQITANVALDPDLDRSRVVMNILSGRGILKLYGALDSNQRAMLFNPTGLNIRVLPPDASRAADELLTGRDPLWARPEVRTVDLTAVREPIEKTKRFKYTFTATTDYGMDPLKWEISTPEYKEPPKEEPEEQPEEERSNKAESAKG